MFAPQQCSSLPLFYLIFCYFTSPFASFLPIPAFDLLWLPCILPTHPSHIVNPFRLKRPKKTKYPTLHARPFVRSRFVFSTFKDEQAQTLIQSACTDLLSVRQSASTSQPQPASPLHRPTPSRSSSAHRSGPPASRLVHQNGMTYYRTNNGRMFDISRPPCNAMHWSWDCPRNSKWGVPMLAYAPSTQLSPTPVVRIHTFPCPFFPSSHQSARTGQNLLLLLFLPDMRARPSSPKKIGFKTHFQAGNEHLQKNQKNFRRNSEKIHCSSLSLISSYWTARVSLVSPWKRTFRDCTVPVHE